MDALDNIFSRRSIRAFEEKPISRENLEIIAKAAIYAPSGMNRQTWQFTVISERSKIQQLAGAIAAQLGRDGYDMYNPAALIIASNLRDSNWGKEDCACALENIFLAANALGIGSVWINQLGGICDEPNIRKVLDEFGLPADHLVFGMAALGYAAQPPREPDKNQAVIHWA
ncbi:MAG: nitroreductase family protein [Clostridia bacterium]|nr:nitroreductase family protein [Clostridia bacterium]